PDPALPPGLTVPSPLPRSTRGLTPITGARPAHQKRRPAASARPGSVRLVGTATGGGAPWPKVTSWNPAKTKRTRWPAWMLIVLGRKAFTSAWALTPFGGWRSGGPALTVPGPAATAAAGAAASA